HARLFNGGEQLLKSDPNGQGGGVTNSTVEYSTLEYTNGPPATDHGGGAGYTNGIDVHGGTGWVVRNNLCRGFPTPDTVPCYNQWNPVVLFWNHSAGATVQRNTFLDSDRAI